MSNNDDDDDDRGPPIAWGDIATLILAAIFALTGFFLIFGPSPFAGLKAQHPAPPPAASGEVTIGIGQGSTIHQPGPIDIKPPAPASHP